VSFSPPDRDVAGQGPRPLAGLRFSVVGPGRVGASLAAWAVGAGARLVGSTGRRGLSDLATGDDDLLLLAVPDGALAAVAECLAHRPQAAVVLHTAGSLGASVLSPLRCSGSAIGTLHPLKAFPRPLLDPSEARGTFFAIDGDPAAAALAARLALAWEGVAGEVPEAARILYHFAGTLAAGGVTTLLAAAVGIAERLDLPSAALPAVAGGLAELSRGAVAGASAALALGRPLASAITGPAARRDLETLLREAASLGDRLPEALPLTLALWRETLRQTPAVADHGPIVSEGNPDE
jgi:predicted short-subunit dehydrogenase-like oxidoreductase (DUF2520 family)